MRSTESVCRRMNSAFGTWKSPITADHIVQETISLTSPIFDGTDIYWLESRAREQGRNVIVQRTSGGQCFDVIQAPFDARSGVHEYGGGEFTVDQGVLYFTNFNDQRIYRKIFDQEPAPITFGSDLRYADLTVIQGTNRLIAVREDHGRGREEPTNTLVLLNLDNPGDEKVLIQGNDFYASPVIHPNSKRLAWLSWDHPNMPWDGTDLWVADLEPDGSVSAPRKVAGGLNESILQPQWAPDGTLYFISDRSGWWNLYRLKDLGLEAICSRDAEFARPPWTFGKLTYAFESVDRIICSYSELGFGTLARLYTESGYLESIETPYTDFEGIRIKAGSLVCRAGSPRRHRELVLMKLGSGEVEILQRSANFVVDEAYLSVAQPIEFPTENGLTAHALFYPPKNDDHHAPEGEKAPLLVASHGGPTGSADSTLDLTVQFWTSRGFAVVDVNYGGSAGYGRVYRERLKGLWGVVDVDDCVNAARHLINAGYVDPNRIAIRGRSAGGYTTLSAVTFRDFFKAGASYYGVSNLEALAADTHKFESRYLEFLVGPYPEQADLYKARSPINSVDQLSSPMIFFQGLNDKVVPPNQSIRMVDALRGKRLPVAYVPFEGEGHGFRMGTTIKSALESELYFFSRVFGFTPDDELPAVEIKNLIT